MFLDVWKLITANLAWSSIEAFDSLTQFEVQSKRLLID